MVKTLTLLTSKIKRFSMRWFIHNFSAFMKCATKTWPRGFCSVKLLDVDLKINNISLNHYLKYLQKEYATLKNNVLKSGSDESRLIHLEPIINILLERENAMQNISNLSELLQDKDKDIKLLADEEKKLVEQQIKSLDEKLLLALVPVDKEDSCNSIVLEVNSGVGGKEAMLFASELFDMYCNFSKYKGWDFQIAEYAVTDLGGIRHASALVSGDSVFQYFRYEAGVHRVQRIPVTEKSGRIHTSTISVLALPQPTDIDIQLQEKDLKIETKRATGAGGQHVNTTDSAVRIVHLPTGTSVECQVDRSQIKNRQIALQRLRAKLYQQKLEKQLAETEATKRSQVRSSFRNEKIRTYNFSQDRITDHRLQGYNVHNLKSFLLGGEPLDSLINKIHSSENLANLLKIVQDFEQKN